MATQSGLAIVDNGGQSRLCPATGSFGLALTCFSFRRHTMLRFRCHLRHRVSLQTQLGSGRNSRELSECGDVGIFRLASTSRKLSSLARSFPLFVSDPFSPTIYPTEVGQAAIQRS